MMYVNPVEPKKIKSWRDVHKKIGQIIVLTPGDSDYQEGNFMEEILFRTESEVFLIFSHDVRKEVEK